MEKHPMATITVEDAQAHLKELIARNPGEELAIEEGGQTVARLIVEKKPLRQPRVPGLCKGMITIVADDNDHLRDFAEYME
jgi:antitoxin (DNA-binding transcriptional repressor) of toxin-antitoxin stability system